MIKKLPTLYKKTKKGKIYTWRVWSDGDKYYTEYGELDGKTQTTENIAESKNIGKSNGTTPEEQAFLEAQTLFNNKKLKNYLENIDDVDNFTPSPMLADKFLDHKNKIKYPAHIQPKLNGLRCLAYWENGEIVLRSRKSKDYSCLHIKEILKAHLPQNFMFDGELYKHGMPLQEINSLAKKQQPDTDKLEYHVYDIYDFEKKDLTWKERYKHLVRHIHFDGHLCHKIFRVDAWGVDSEDEVFSRHEDFTQQKYEGSIVRNLDGKYLHDYRSTDLLKVKDFHDEEFKVVGFKSGKGRFKDSVIWICELKDGRTFSVVPEGTMEEKKYFLDNAQDYIGKFLTVRYQEYSSTGIPTILTGLHFRIEEDLP